MHNQIFMCLVWLEDVDEKAKKKNEVYSLSIAFEKFVIHLFLAKLGLWVP